MYKLTYIYRSISFLRNNTRSIDQKSKNLHPYIWYDTSCPPTRTLNHQTPRTNVRCSPPQDALRPKVPTTTRTIHHTTHNSSNQEIRNITHLSILNFQSDTTKTTIQRQCRKGLRHIQTHKDFTHTYIHIYSCDVLAPKLSKGIGPFFLNYVMWQTTTTTAANYFLFWYVCMF